MAIERQTAILPGARRDEPLAWTARLGDVAFSSTITAADSTTGGLASGAEEQFAQAFAHLRSLLDHSGLTSDDVAQLTVVINDASYRPFINKPWMEMFPSDDSRPARKTNHAPLPAGELVNLHVVAVAGGGREPLEIPGLAHRDPLPMGIKAGNLVLSSVLGGDVPAGGDRPEGEAQIDQAFHNMQSLIERAGGTVDDIAHVWVFLGDFAYQPYMVKVWVDMFPEDGNRPARKTVSYDLGGRTTLIQMQMAAVLGSGRRDNFEIEGIGHHDPIPLANKQGNFLYSSGISGMDPSTGVLAEGPERQAAQALQNAGRVMELAGATTRNLAQVTALVGDNSYRPAVMNAWREFFPSVDDQPALHLLNLGVSGRDTLVQLNVVGVL